jgi:hypothetical protein
MSGPAHSPYQGDGVVLVMSAVFGVAALRYLAKARRKKRAGEDAVTSMNAFKVGFFISMTLIATAILHRFLI